MVTPRGALCYSWCHRHTDARLRADTSPNMRQGGLLIAGDHDYHVRSIMVQDSSRAFCHAINTEIILIKSLSRSLSGVRALSLSQALSLTHSGARARARSLSESLTHSLSLSGSLSQALSLSPSLSESLNLAMSLGTQ